MKKMDHVILGVHVTDRLRKADQVQKLFTEYGCSIKTRLGLHEASETVCSPAGLILLEMAGGRKTALELAAKLGKIKGVEVQKMVFRHP